jgi:hypothetical protein
MEKKDAENTETASSQGLLIVEGGFEDQVQNRTPPKTKRKCKNF